MKHTCYILWLKFSGVVVKALVFSHCCACAQWEQAPRCADGRGTAHARDDRATRGHGEHRWRATVHHPNAPHTDQASTYESLHIFSWHTESNCLERIVNCASQKFALLFVLLLNVHCRSHDKALRYECLMWRCIFPGFVFFFWTGRERCHRYFGVVWWRST